MRPRKTIRPAKAVAATAAPIALTAVVLGLILGDRLLFHTAPAGTSEYHQAVQRAADEVPLVVGSWLGTKLVLPAAAVTLLHPNVGLCHQYRNVTTGRVVTFLLVQCHDARDLVGHYPPICYVNQGWVMDTSTATQLSAGDLRVNATRYGFTSGRLGQMASLRIDNFMILPTGETCPNMDGIYVSAKDPHKKFFGAAQVQFVCDADVPLLEVEEFEQALLISARPLIDQIRAGVRP